MYILGISAYYHDSAAALLHNGEIVAAAQEERFSRKKHDHDFPRRAIGYCLSEAAITAEQIDVVAFYDKPFLKFTRLLETYLSFPLRGLSSFLMAMPLWIRQKLWIPDLIEKELDYHGTIIFPEHHESHAASAFFPSPFKKAAILTVDGVGEWATASIGTGNANKVEILSELQFPHSLGLLYSAFTYFTGFKVNSGEYKLMGLAPYGEPRYVQTILDQLIDLKEDGSFRLDLSYFDYLTGLKMTSKKFDRLFGGPPRQPESPLTRREMDMARSIQEVTEEIILRMARHVKKVTGMEYLCLAGGVALNSVANGKILRSGIFKDIWIQPAAGDAGGALGAAYVAHHHFKNANRKITQGKDSQCASLLGPVYTETEINTFLKERNIPFEQDADESLLNRVAEAIADGKVIGWFQGRMEFGPRALGNRSILADARSPEMQRKLNLKIKFREGFRPFAPAVLEEAAEDWFYLDRPSPYMLLVCDVRPEKRLPVDKEAAGLNGLEKLNVPRSQIPAVTHVDYSARIQTVNRRDNPLFYDLLAAFYRKTGCPVVINTSFNVRGEPIVNSPEDAYRCFMRTNMDMLVMGTHILQKEKQPQWQEQQDWRTVYELD
ncbi:MAG TPA: hypothetical protein ENK44_15465 [Caldithrix abyssi]|uniref:Carbamoyltransferase n=1 Tax=Caldithrix abyssi TaxID=187145 RepID=A0A7V4WX01_CALAY|nr:hypothetical protein [Caldithrix abyssi]